MNNGWIPMTAQMINGTVALDATIDDYLTGRLSASERSHLETLIEQDPAVRQRVDVLRAQEEALRHLGADILDEPLPEHLLAALALPE